VQALDKLAEHFAEDVPPRTFAKVRKVLMADQRAVRRRVLDRDDAFARVTADVEAARERVKGWTLGHNGWAALKGGLERVYRDGYQAFARARAEPAVENLHEWRKQVKYLWHQLQVLQPVWPGVMEQLAEQAHLLTQLLGEDHDLAVLREKVC